MEVPEFGSDEPPSPGTADLVDEAWFAAEQCEYSGHNNDSNCTWSDEERLMRAKHKQKAPSPLSAITDLVLLRVYSSCAAQIQIQIECFICACTQEPIFYEYGVDIYWAGHIHFYNRFDGPVRKGRTISKGTHNPRGTLHACTGNGGPPSPSKCTCQDKFPFRKHCVTCVNTPYSYTRLTVFNATDLLWEQVSNADNSIIDTWTVHQSKHGSFDPPDGSP